MRYVFKLGVFGNPETAVKYLSSALEDSGEDKGTYTEWYNEIKILEDICDLEIVVITDIINAEFDEFIPSVDGIIYFLNPMNENELDFFRLILPIIFSVKRDIPTVILFYDSDGVIPISTNELLETIWVNYPNLEAFVNVDINQFQF